MHYAKIFAPVLLGITGCTIAQSTEGIYSLVRRRMNRHADSFRFDLVNVTNYDDLPPANKPNDRYIVSTTDDGKIGIEGNSLSAILTGLHRYLRDNVHVDIYWFIGSMLDSGPPELPHPLEPIEGSSVVPWRYDLNTVTFSYSAAFWDWEDWELQLDWMALRGVNLPLAWLGYEKILVEVFRETGFTDTEILSFLSGPAFLPWNRFGNIQGSWGGVLPESWIDGQFELQKKILLRMTELGMTPVLPAFPGFVPRAVRRVLPNATVVNSGDWAGFPTQYSYDTFLEPSNEDYLKMQESFLLKQRLAFGNVTHIYTLDQYNEMNPSSGDPTHLRNVATRTIQSLKAVDPQAIWLMQGWLFFEAASFWTAPRVEAYLGGVNNTDMLILDLISESAPQWQRTHSYYGKPWIWCTLHSLGGNMNLYGQIQNLTQNSTAARIASDSLVGFGLTMEGQQTNEIMFDLLLEQAWSINPIKTKSYFDTWVTARYSVGSTAPHELYEAWNILRKTVYNNTNLSATKVAPKAVLTFRPGFDLADQPLPYSIVNMYDPSVVVQAWKCLFEAAIKEQTLWENPSYQFDIVDITRQVIADAFTSVYMDFKALYNNSSSKADILATGTKMLALLYTLDSVLETNENFHLDKWIHSARSLANDSEEAAFYEYNARNLITIFGPTGEINDYASKQWSGLVSTYFIPRWRIFVDYVSSTPVTDYNSIVVDGKLSEFELRWQREPAPTRSQLESRQERSQRDILMGVAKLWPDIFGGQY